MKFLLQRARWAFWLLLIGVTVPAHAITQLTLTIGRARVPMARISRARVLIRLKSRGLSLEARAGSIRVRKAGIPPLRGVRLSCARMHIGDTLGCRGGRFAAHTGTLGLLRGTFAADYAVHGGAVHLRAARMPLAGGHLKLSGTLHSGVWRLTASATRLDLARAAHLVRPWLALPAGYRISGPITVRLSAGNHPALRVRFHADSPSLNVSNAPGTVVSEHISASVEGALAQAGTGATAVLRLEGTAGQALAGPVYLDLGAHPVTLRVRAARRGAHLLEVSELDLRVRGVIAAHASALLQLGAHPTIRSARATLTRLTFPGAYTSFLEMQLASSPLGSLKSSGWMSGSLRMRADAIERVDATLHGLNFKDQAAGLLVSDANGTIHWTAASGVSLPRSSLSWRKVGVYGLTGGPAHLAFLAWSHNFALLGGNVRLPVFDGAIIVHTLVGRGLGTAHAQLVFNADLTPISMPVLCKAFGWPVMNGQLYGHIPLVRYRKHVLKFDGDLVAHVFDGVITGSHIQLDNPLGQWPQLYADVKARGLNLGMVTRTFAFGSMTGRIDADINGLKLFDWSPVAFDARIYTMPGDRTRHLISQNAVTRIAAFGGGGGEVTAALESGVLRFFKTFHYRRLAIGCRLRNEVCHMSGVRPSDDGGYYLVEGSWLPRLDIIGNVRRVNWPQMLSEIKHGISSGGVKVN